MSQKVYGSTHNLEWFNMISRHSQIRFKGILFCAHNAKETAIFKHIFRVSVITEQFDFMQRSLWERLVVSEGSTWCNATKWNKSRLWSNIWEILLRINGESNPIKLVVNGK